MQIKVNRVGDFTASQKLRLEQAESVLNSIIETLEFKQTVASLDPKKYFTGTALKPRDLAEIFGDATKGQIKPINVRVWYVPWYKRYTSAVAYESNNMINLRSTYLESGTLKNICSTLLHEYMHTIGFSHDFWNTKRRPFSVPYAIGNLVGIYQPGVFAGMVPGSLVLRDRK